MAKGKADGRFLSRREAGERLGVSADTVARLITLGDLRAYRIGRQVRVEASEIERYLDAARLPFVQN